MKKLIFYIAKVKCNLAILLIYFTSLIMFNFVCLIYYNIYIYICSSYSPEYL